MSHLFSGNQQNYQSFTKTVFLSQMKKTTTMCGLCQKFDQKQTLVCHKQIKFETEISPKYFIKPDSNLKKLSKKSLKPNSRLKEFFVNKANSVQPTQQKGSQKVQNSTKMNSENIIRSIELKKHESNNKGINFCRKLGVSSNSQIASEKKVSHSSSCKNITNDFLKSSFQINPNIQNDNFSSIQLVHSINAKANVIKNQRTGKYKEPIPKDFKFELINFKSSITQNLAALSISPVKYMTIPQESERSAFIQSSRNYKDMTSINKLIELNTPLTLGNRDFHDQSELTLKTPQNQKDSKQLSQYILKVKIPEQSMPTIPKYERHISQKSIQRDFLQISLHQLQIYEQSFIFPNLKQSKQKPEPLDLADSFTQQYPLEINYNAQKVLSSDIENEINQQQNMQIEQKPVVVTPPRISKNGGNAFGRYSVQIPKSKNFKNLKVRRTISMKDQEDSSQEETSEVIYGFRKTNMQIMEDIAEDMQESCMTRTDIMLNTSDKRNFHNF